jgi:hypothetical protein
MGDFRFEGRGRVLNFGTIGWVGAAMRDETVARITGNALELLLTEPRRDES